jgi:hypothetical protein
MRTKRDRDTPGRRWQRWALLAATVAVLAGCASMNATAGVPITSFAVIAGHWAGTVTHGHNGWGEPFHLTITPDKTRTASWGANTTWGNVTIRGGQATFEMQPLLYEGSLTLYLDGGQRSLVLDGLWDSFTAQVTAAR